MFKLKQAADSFFEKINSGEIVVSPDPATGGVKIDQVNTKTTPDNIDSQNQPLPANNNVDIQNNDYEKPKRPTWLIPTIIGAGVVLITTIVLIVKRKK